MKNTEGPFLVLSLLILALGIGYAGQKIHSGLVEFRSYDRYVTVKGLVTRDVTSDLAIWPLAQTVTGDDLASTQNILEERGTKIVNFLKARGITDNEIDTQQIKVQDLLAQTYRNTGIQDNRFILTQLYVVRTNNISAVSKAAQALGELVKQGVIFSSDFQSGPTYLFTQLNTIKPEMIAEATQNAREAAAQFAADSGQKIGGIRKASQGVFQIQPRDEVYSLPESAQKDKTVRVVSTVEFYLE